MSRQTHDPPPILRDEPLPEFEHPPIAEVALSVAFDPIDLLRVPQIGLLWLSKYRDRFPVVEEQVPLEPMREHLEGTRPPQFSISFEAGSAMPRLWFLNSEGTELIQLQRNWFARNWRKLAASGRYPRYPHLKDTFLADYGEFCAFAREEKLGDPSPTQCEITYVNQIGTTPEWSSPSDLHKVLKVYRSVPDDIPGPAEQTRLVISWVMTLDAKPVGRLHCTVSPATSIDKNESLIILTLTARGSPLADGEEGIVKFFDVGREYIVRTFDAITTEGMHRSWGKVR